MSLLPRLRSVASFVQLLHCSAALGDACDISQLFGTKPSSNKARDQASLALLLEPLQPSRGAGVELWMPTSAWRTSEASCPEECLPFFFGLHFVRFL